MEVVTFYNRGKRFGTIGVKFFNEEAAIKYSTTALRSADLTLMLIFMGKRNIRA